MSRPRVLHLISALDRGGRERQLALIQRHTRDDMTSLIALKTRSENDYVGEYGLRESDYRGLGAGGRAAYLKKLRALLAEFKPDVVWAWGKADAFHAWLLQPLFRYRVVSGFIRAAKFVKGPVDSTLQIITAHLSRYIVGNSLAGLRLFRVKRGYLLRNGYEYRFPAQEDVDALRARLGLLEGVPVLTSVANLLPVKDYATVLDALAILRDEGRDFRYLLLGEGPTRGDIEAQIERLGLQKQALPLGAVSHVPRYLALTDIFVHSSFSEGTSNAIVEALLAGLPVVASATGGTPEIVQNDRGRLFACQDTAALAGCLRELLDSPDLRRELGQAGQDYANREFALSAMLERYTQIVDDAYNRKTAHRAVIR